MQDDEQILYTAIGKVIKARRMALNKPFTIFCYENDVPTTSLGCIENARRKVHLSKILQIVECLGLSYEQFFMMLVSELPKDFKFKKQD